MHPVNMGTLSGTSEIVELMEKMDSGVKMDEASEKHRMLKKLGQICSIEDDINKLFEAIDIRNYGRSSILSQQGVRDGLRKSAMKRPMRPGSFQAYGIGISETVTLKQALRGLCISQASELAAMKRLPKPESSSRVSEAGTIKRLYRSGVVEAGDSGLSLKEGKCNLLEICLVPEGSTSNISETAFQSGQFPNVELLNQSAYSSTLSVDAPTSMENARTILPEDEILPTYGGYEISMTELEKNGNPTSTRSSFSTHICEKSPALDKIAPTSAEVFGKSLEPDKLHFVSSPSSDNVANNSVVKSSKSSQRILRPIFGNKNFVTKKVKQDVTSVPGSSNQRNGSVDNDLAPSTSKMVFQGPYCSLEYGSEAKEKLSPVSSNNTNISSEVSSSAMDSRPGKPGLNSNSRNRTKTLVLKTGERSRSREKGEFSQSSMCSIGQESTLSDMSRCGYRPQMLKDERWDAIHHIQKQHGSVGLRHFKILKKLGSGDIGTIYLVELTGTNCLFALKIMNYEFLASKKKIPRARAEKETLQMLDHPFLPTIFAHFTADKLSCLVMEYCPGGDLRVLQQKQPNKRFSEQAARFYVAEVLLALEYLHTLGVVHRDLKPKNILIREDGHIMLSGFDLSLRCAVNPTQLKPSPVVEYPKRDPNPCTESSCISPFCFQPSWQVPCFTPRLISVAAKTRKLKAEPTSVLSHSFAGTREYSAPEIIKGEDHGSAVDWWTLGIFLYELLYGKTPFKGLGKEDTLSNVVSQSLDFPAIPNVSSCTRDLIGGLLVKEPENRLGSVEGAAEIKQHPFFEGLDWDLIGCATPPDLPKIV